MYDYSVTITSTRKPSTFAPEEIFANIASTVGVIMIWQWMYSNTLYPLYMVMMLGEIVAQTYPLASREWERYHIGMHQSDSNNINHKMPELANDMFSEINFRKMHRRIL